ncbi:MAG: hypothetical protein NVS9B14_17110 [Candidatus Acidiferrum sp.]
MRDSGQWFERKFEFHFSADLYPNLSVRLRGTPARLEELLHDVSPDRLTERQNEKWSIQEQAGHLLDLESLWSVRVDDFLAPGKERLSPADLQNRKTHEANHNARNIADVLKEFRSARTALAQRLDTLDASLFSRTLLHPRLEQPLRLVDHLYFVAEHDDHHLAKIWAALNF